MTTYESIHPARLVGALALAALTALAGCASLSTSSEKNRPEANGAKIEGEGLARWELVRWQDANGALRALPQDGEPVTLLFSDGIDAAQGTVSGNTGCNRVRGAYEKTPGGIRFHQLISTRRACDPQRMAVESGLQAALAAPLETAANQPSEAAPGGRQVVWKTAAGELLQFKEREPARNK